MEPRLKRTVPWSCERSCDVVAATFRVGAFTLHRIACLIVNSCTCSKLEDDSAVEDVRRILNDVRSQYDQ
eukprot:3165816-Amphidinium_carterae.1